MPRAAFVEVLVAARDLAPGQLLARADVVPLSLPEPFVLTDFVSAKEAGLVLGQKTAVSVPRGGLLFRLDFDLDSGSTSTSTIPPSRPTRSPSRCARDALTGRTSAAPVRALAVVAFGSPAGVIDDALD
jgi:hypothetical protein